ncbi:family 16 glycosylhydrolase [Paraglaciecola sp. 20A4]|uniref:family 16 glycosylhydrolase n=1 Tax=Paraglaciecola sp. 20A4 TaxID=2687288 RepID=UPI001981699C|nr:family 16 glycosylhydrolase [Paraglaciecola sp. 20A4]
MKANFTKAAIILLTTQGLMACQSDADPTDTVNELNDIAQVTPISDPQNEAGWILNTAISDEFTGNEIDRSKWLVQGDNNEYYIWKGRAPSQFAPHNVIVEDGLLKLKSQWEPDFAFAEENYADGDVDAGYGVYEDEPMPITTAAIVSHQRFLNGYMEVRSKAIDAAMTSAFWALGYQSELDIFEQMGRPTIEGNIREDYVKSTAHDWRPPAKRPTWAFQHSEKYPFRVADEFHVYAAEWGQDYLKLFTDGKLIYSVTQKELGDKWVLTNPLEIWLDSEIFQWLGMPHKEELPGSFDVDYVRVWQKPQDNTLQRAFYSFEGPQLFDKNPKPLKMAPESSKDNAYQQFWEFPGASSEHASLVYERATKGKASLKIEADASDNALVISAIAPDGSVNVPAGEYEICFDVWLAPDSTWKTLNLDLINPKTTLHFDLQAISKGLWVSLSQPLTRKSASGANDALNISIDSSNLISGKSTLFIDNVALKKAK